jgi:hypothetical protein
MFIPLAGLYFAAVSAMPEKYKSAGNKERIVVQINDKSCSENQKSKFFLDVTCFYRLVMCKR